jgi:hypothetical protein
MASKPVPEGIELLNIPEVQPCLSFNPGAEPLLKGAVFYREKLP